MNTKTTKTKQLFVANNRGMSLPVALLLGLVTTGVALAVIAKSQTDKGKTVAEVNAVKSSTIAESGVNQYLDFLNNNRILLTYPSCVGTVNPSTGACPDSGTTKSWSNVANAGILPTTTSSPNGNTCPKSTPNSPNTNQSSSTQISTVWANTANTGWKTAEGGQYKLVEYSYTPNGAANTAPGQGKLIIEGRTNVNGSGSSATDDPTRTARTRIAITIPVTVGPSGTPSPTNVSPAIWAKDFSMTGNPTVYADVWDSSNCLTGTQPLSSGRVDKVPVNPINVARASNNGNSPQYTLSTRTGIITAKQQDFPDLPNNNTYTAPTGANVNTIACPYNPSGNVTFPRTGDRTTNGAVYGTNAPSGATYVYKICSSSGSSLNVSGTTVTLGRSAGETFVFYLDGNFSTGSNGNLQPYPVEATGTGTLTSTGTTKTTFYMGPNARLNIGSNGNIGKPKDPTALQFYLYTQDGSTVNQGGSLQSVQLTGNGSFYGFIFAPFANARVWGTGDIAGALWAKSYVAGGNGGFLAGIFNTSRLDVSLDSGTPVPALGQATSWERLPVP